VDRVTNGYIFAKAENGKRRREPLHVGWNVRLKERRELRTYLERVAPPEKLQMNSFP